MSLAKMEYGYSVYNNTLKIIFHVWYLEAYGFILIYNKSSIN